jgi:hypothetical protein
MRVKRFNGGEEGGSGLRTRGRPESAREVLKGLIWSWGLGPKFIEHLACRLWCEVVGQEGAVHSRVEGIRDGVVVVAADSGSAAQWLGLQKVELLARLREVLAREVGRGEAEGALRDVRFVSRGWAGLAKVGRMGVSSGTRETGKQAAGAECLSAAERARLEDLLGEVRNEELRELLRRGLSGLISASGEKGGKGANDEG